MTKWVLPNVLSVDDTLLLDMEVLKVLSKVSTGVILKYINNFIKAEIDSTDLNMQQAASKLKEAYKEVNDINSYLEGDEAKKLADTLVSLQYSDIKHEVETAKLIAYRELILDLLSEDEDFMKSYLGEVDDNVAKGYKTAYTAKLDMDNLEEAINQIGEIMVKSSGAPRQAASRLISVIDSNKNLFKNGNNKINRPTVLRKAIYQKDRLKSILKGIDYLLAKKESGASPRSWRRI